MRSLSRSLTMIRQNMAWRLQELHRSFSSTSSLPSKAIGVESNIRKKVVIGMSGGVDSSVAAGILVEQGYEVVGIHMRNWDSSDEQGNESCPANEDYIDAKKVCAQIGIPCVHIDFVKPYWNRVFSPCLESYEAGETPNPDILCNREIKFKALLNHALESMGADYIATGHYARIERRNEHAFLYAGKDTSKDQSYFLCAVSGHVLTKILFPLGELNKSQVRRMARDQKLCTAQKRDSVGICFVGKRRKFQDFLSEYISETPGDIRSIENESEILGRHPGLCFYTIGQGAKLSGMAQKWFVVDKRKHDQTLLVAPGQVHPALYSDDLYAATSDFNWINRNMLSRERTFYCLIRIRYRQDLSPAKIRLVENDDGQEWMHVTFHEPQRGVTSGQLLALYNQDGMCYGGGPILKSGPSYFTQKKALPLNLRDWARS